ncbi:MAG: response regulator [Balneolaceae bacterium]|nr:MAG: response regulator [Balneolaceae bacterium]
MSPQRKTSYKLLIIEDNPGDLTLIEEYLKENGLGVNPDSANTYKAAKEYLSGSEPSYDAILLDLILPDLEGEPLIEEILQLAGSIPIIVLTGYSDIKFGVKSLSLGVSDYLIKDELSSDILWKSIRYSIERSLVSNQLKESEQRYRHLFENNPFPILIWELESQKIVDLNREAEIKYGYSKEQFLTLNIQDIQPESPAISKPDIENGEGKSSRSISNGTFVKHQKKEGDVFFAEVKKHYIEHLGKESVLLIVNDITDKIEFQERMLENVLRAEEEERNRIAKELHDGIVQQLVACGMFTQHLHEKIGKPEEMKQEIDRLFNLIKQVTHETRDMSHNLKPAEFEFTPLSHLIQQLTRQISKVSGIRFETNSHLTENLKLDVYLKTNIYRILQELCSNVIKHSNADEAVITLEIVDQLLFLSMYDNGSGFEVNAPEDYGIGLRNVRSRVHRLGGDVEFNVMESKGLKVNIELPVT